MSTADNEYDVQAIIGYRHNTTRGCVEYLIKWADFGDEGNSWESASNLAGLTLEVARKYQTDMDNLPQQTSTYRRQARKLLMNSFQRVSCAAIDKVLSLCKYNFTRSYHYLAEINNHRTANGNGAGQFVLIPKSVKVFNKSNRAKVQLELSDETLLGEVDDIPALNTKEGKTATTTDPPATKPVIDLSADSDDDDEEKEEERECLCCFGDYPVSELLQCSAGVGHYICRECINRYVSEQLDGNGSTTFQCIASAECSCQYTLAFLDQVLSPTLKKRTNEMVALEEIKKAGVDDASASYWSCPKCAYMGFLDGLGLPSSIYCPQCNVSYCTRCNVNHGGSSCEEYQRQQAVGKDPKLLAAEAMSRACKRSCPHCGQKFMKADGCNKITCNRCKRFSCYLCGEMVNNYSHFCNTRGCNCDKCSLYTSTSEMESIDKRKRQKAGREVLLEQGITDEEEIAAILNSLDEEEDNQSVDTAAAVNEGRVGNQGQRAPHPGPRLLYQEFDAEFQRLNEIINANNARMIEHQARFNQRMANFDARVQRVEPPMRNEMATRAQRAEPPVRNEIAARAQRVEAPVRNEIAARGQRVEPPVRNEIAARAQRVEPPARNEIAARAQRVEPPVAGINPAPQARNHRPNPQPQDPGLGFGNAAPPQNMEFYWLLENAPPAVARNPHPRQVEAEARRHMDVLNERHARLDRRMAELDAAVDDVARAANRDHEHERNAVNPAPRAENNLLDPNPPPQRGFAVGNVAQPERVAPPQAQEPFAFGNAAARQPQRAAPPPQFVFGTPANRRNEVPNQAQQPTFRGIAEQVGQNEHNRNRGQQNVNQLAANFGGMGLGQPNTPNRQVHARAEDDINGEDYRAFCKLMKKASKHARDGNERKMNEYLARARALTERPGAFFEGIRMNEYEAWARNARRALEKARG